MSFFKPGTRHAIPLLAGALLGLVPLAAGAQGSEPCAHEGQLRSLNSDRRTELVLVNDGARPFTLYWLDFQGRRRAYATVAPGQTHVQPTYATHPWILVGPAGNCLMVVINERFRRTVRVADDATPLR